MNLPADKCAICGRTKIESQKNLNQGFTNGEGIEFCEGCRVEDDRVHELRATAPRLERNVTKPT